jgi:hypothetical protein
MMMNLSELPRRELERLSAYLDGALSPKETARLEARLRAEPELRAALEEMRETVWLLRSIPEVKPSRSFTLSPEMVGKRERSRAYPRLQLATALVAAAFVFVIGFDLLGSAGARRAMAPAAEISVADEVAPAEAPVVEKEALEGVAPGEEFFAGEEGAAVAEPEMEAAAKLEEAEEGLKNLVTPEGTEVPPSAAEDAYRAEAPPAVGTVEGVGDDAIAAVDESAAEETGVAERDVDGEEVPPPSDQRISAPPEVGETDIDLEPRIIHPLRMLEISLGILFLLLLTLTLTHRRKTR